MKSLIQKHLEAIQNHPFKLAKAHAEITSREIEKLRALLEGLETQHIDKLMNEGKVGDFKRYGEAYFKAVKREIEIARLEERIAQYKKFKPYLSAFGDEEMQEEIVKLEAQLKEPKKMTPEEFREKYAFDSGYDEWGIMHMESKDRNKLDDAVMKPTPYISLKKRKRR